MGYSDLKNRLTNLKSFVDEHHEGQISFFKALLVSLFAVSLLASVLPAREQAETSSIRSSLGGRFTRQTGIRKEGMPGVSIQETDTEELWFEETEDIVRKRAQWLEESVFGISSADRYLGYVRTVIDLVFDDDNPGESGAFSRAFVSSLLRIGFVFLSFWPLWVVAVVASYLVVPIVVKKKPTDDILGLCDPGKTPFYSGIYGPLRPNNDSSGTDFSCPSLACPKQASKQVALGHELGKMLQELGVSSNTNLALVSIILAYSDYPGFVDDEREDVEDNSEIVDEIGTFDPMESSPAVQKSIIAPSEWTVERSAVVGLQAVIEAHRGVVRLEKVLKGSSQDSKHDDGFIEFRGLVNDYCQDISPLAKILLKSLTPHRVCALAQLPIEAVVSSYLATEAGKALVFQKIEGGFSQNSLFPNLQARAVLHSLPSYHKEYSGNIKSSIRQAIVCSRRHGDFGRAFLPVNMPVSSRGLRDWLEILYASPEQRYEVAHLVELDGHIEEVHVVWRRELARRLHSDAASSERKEGNISASCDIWKGIPFKSVILMPIADLLQLATDGLSEVRQKRILELIELTREQQSKVSISARLPGFKRQAMEIEKEAAASSSGVQKMLAASPTGPILLDKWLIVRRMLTRYNWLSTRVGDDSVPVDGMLQAVVVLRMLQNKLEVAGLDALVPLRQRRFKLLFGESWESRFYHSSPHPDDVEIFTNIDEFNERLSGRLGAAQKEDGLKPEDNNRAHGNARVV